MSPELTKLATERHAAWLAWDGSEGTFERFCNANRLYVQQRDAERRSTINQSQAS